MKKLSFLVLCVMTLCFVACQKQETHGKVVVCVPVYGQSLALGEETQRITNIDSLNNLYDHRIVDENLDNNYGYYENSPIKRKIKRLLGFSKRDFEVSVYGMAESLVKSLGKDTLVCIFAGGQGATPINGISKGTAPYERFLKDIISAKEKADERGMKFYVPVVCWMQGESDMYDYTHVNYKQRLKKFAIDINKDVKAITHQTQDVKIVSYQTNLLSVCNRFDAQKYDSYEITIPKAQMELVRDDESFVAGTPTYPFIFARERLHIDAVSQKRVGYYHAKEVMNVVRNTPSLGGLYPKKILCKDNRIEIVMNVPCPPLVIDTVAVRKIDYAGFNVLTSNGQSIIRDVEIHGDTVVISCSQRVNEAKVRYAVNGERGKSGCVNGARGNLRDSQGNKSDVLIQEKWYPLHHWCYQFEVKIESD